MVLSASIIQLLYHFAAIHSMGQHHIPRINHIPSESPILTAHSGLAVAFRVTIRCKDVESEGGIWGCGSGGSKAALIITIDFIVD